MIYNKRCILKRYETREGYLGNEPRSIPITQVLACAASPLSLSSQERGFGSSQRKDFVLHIQGIHDLESESSEIIYKGIKRDIKDVRYHRNKTVVVMR